MDAARMIADRFALLPTVTGNIIETMNTEKLSYGGDGIVAAKPRTARSNERHSTTASRPTITPQP